MREQECHYFCFGWNCIKSDGNTDDLMLLSGSDMCGRCRNLFDVTGEPDTTIKPQVYQRLTQI